MIMQSSFSGRRLARPLVATLAAALAVAAPAAAQSPRTGARAQGQPRNDEARFEAEVERLAREAARMSATRMTLVRQIESLANDYQDADSHKRAELSAKLGGLVENLKAHDRDRTALRRRLSETCARASRPEGWFGAAFTGAVSIARTNDGPAVYRFQEYPTVESVEPGSPAERAGIATGDVLLALGPNDVLNREIVLTELLRPGSRLPVRIQRGGRARSLTVNVTPRPQAYTQPCPWLDPVIARAFADDPWDVTVQVVTPAQPGTPTPPASPRVRGWSYRVQPATPSAPVAPATPGEPREYVSVAPSAPVVTLLPPTSPSLVPPAALSSSVMVLAGAQLSQMNPGMRRVFAGRNGLLVLGVARSTQAERAGIQSGDVILAVDGRAVTSPIELQRALARSAERAVKLRVFRKEPKERTMTVELAW